MLKKRLGCDWFQIWLLTGIAWLVGGAVFVGIRQDHGTASLRWVGNGIEHPPTPEELQRHERIRWIHHVENILAWGAGIYAVTGLVFLRHGLGKVLIAGVIVFFASTLIVGWTKACCHVGADEHGYRLNNLVYDTIGTLVFIAPLGVFLLGEMGTPRDAPREDY